MRTYRELARMIAAHRADVADAVFETLVDALVVKTAPRGEFDRPAFVAACNANRET